MMLPMAIRYSKCHTLPYPSYGLRALSKGSGAIDLNWTNGPPGASTTGLTLIEFALISDTAATTVVTAGYSDVASTLSGIAAGTYRFRLQRVSGIGAGDWTGFTQGEVT